MKIIGRYYINGDYLNPVTIKKIGDNKYSVDSLNWWGTGIIDGKVYFGVFHYMPIIENEHLLTTFGTHLGVIEEGVIRVKGTNVIGMAGTKFDVNWEREVTQNIGYKEMDEEKKDKKSKKR